jgi:dTMP kinase
MTKEMQATSSTLAPQGLFISFEGIDGAGKSTHIESLAAVFRQEGRVVTLTREPGGTPLGEQLRELIIHQRMDALTEALLIFAARREHIVQVIAPALARGEVVLCDRFTDATFAYQGGGRGFDLNVLAQLEQWVQGRELIEAHSAFNVDGANLLQPDLTIWFDLAPALAAERLSTARTPDKFESQSLAFFTRVADHYAYRMQAQPQRFARIDAVLSRDQVWQDVLRILRERAYLAA